ncbi:MAG: DNA-binding transcriptional regulator Fis [Alteromonadaceae bacterium]|jgi:Fis family transcriptional regulator|nr:DNA-binding transcriptional regulator Fis [Alteromonadaceae bacterium]MBL6703267.1 DNA-binding transcriptional regulator Fis [Pseudomonadales bacterium]MBL6901981.1 DNA-binding transcriptional regulator Fis [Luminiphilus sp.]MDA0891272.1 DNA-binding transcriptional regulator Fis [Pseudomonadota bacterium]RCL47489.1 MAG: DNA-binding transcriptional regulator Fis [Halieaceae bacterium]RPH11877.1 MAG: DNA-binding transcriptional regulator Fis [Alteromonadaceae bacterium TMED101]|tara:strand:- start:1640 stop:1882 length:243 start_codon:yes stop_codon:yes gene_type:complete
MSDNTQGALKVAAEDAIRQFIAILDGEDTTDFYELVLAEVEEPLLRVVMEYTGNNQSRAAAMLGLNRGTLRKKLRQYKLL